MSASSSTPVVENDRIVRFADLQSLIGLKKTATRALIANGEFPKPIALTTQARGWRLSEVQRWIASRQRASRKSAVAVQAAAAASKSVAARHAAPKSGARK